jgi:hypothetical protein
LRERTAAAIHQIDTVNADKNLSDFGRAQKKGEIATKALEQIAADAAVSTARETVKSLQEKYNQTVKAALSGPAARAELAPEIRRHIAGLSGAAKTRFLIEHIPDVPTMAALWPLLDGPLYLASLSQADVLLIRSKLAVAPELKAEADKAAEALAALEAGVGTARMTISEAAGVKAGELVKAA